MEERISVLKIQNIELREHLNLAIDTVNNIVKILNGHGPTDGVATPLEENRDGEQIFTNQDMDEDTQPSLSQVYAMYQSQPPDEEGWQEMTNAIEAAEGQKRKREERAVKEQKGEYPDSEGKPIKIVDYE